MKKRILIFCFIIIPSVTFCQSISDSSKSIITNKTNFKHCWIPSKSDTDAALKEVFEYLYSKGYNATDSTSNDYDFRQIPQVLQLMDSLGYCVQFAGYKKGAKKFIRMNFFSTYYAAKDYYDPNITYQGNKLIIKNKQIEKLFWMQCGGGPYLWTITYNYISKRCFRFFVNTVG